MSALLTMRLVLFGLVGLFTLIDFCLLCWMLSLGGGAVSSLALGLATCLLTAAILGGTQAVEHMRKGAITSQVWIEILWAGFLWVMWIAASGSITGQLIFCSLISAGGICSGIEAIKAFSWLNWLAFFIWFWTLLISSIIANSRGNPRIWHTPTAEASFSAVSEKNFQQSPYVAPYNTGSTQAQQPTGYNPQQYTGAPAQQPHQQQYPQQGYGQPNQV